VKFHVSSLLAKFRVRGRMELVREASRHTGASMLISAPVASHEVRSFPQAAGDYSRPQRSAAVVPLSRRPLMA